MTAAGHAAPDRVALLEDCAARIDQHERRALSARPLLPLLGWSVLLLAVAFGGADGPQETGASLGWLVLLVGLWLGCARVVPGPAWLGHAVGAVALVLAGAATLPLVEEASPALEQGLLVAGWLLALIGTAATTARWVRGVRRDVAGAGAAYSLRRQPDGRGDGAPDARPEVATLFDLRRRADFDVEAAGAVARANAGLYSLRATVPSLVLTVTGVIGLVLVLTPLTDLGSAPWHWLSSLSGVLLLAGLGYALGGATLGVVWQRQMEANRTVVEADVYGRQRALALSLPTPRRATLGIGGSAGLLLGLLWCGLLLARLRTSSGLAIAVSLGIVVLAALGVAAWTLRRRSAIRVFPLDGDGPGLLQAPSRAVTLEAVADGVRLVPVVAGPEPVTLGHDDVLGVLDVSGVHAFSGDGVALLTRGAPVVLVGRGVVDHPVVHSLRERGEALSR